MGLGARRSYERAVRERTRRHTRHQELRRRRRGWPLLIFGILLCHFVAIYLLSGSERSATTTEIASVDRPTYAKPPEPPAPPAPARSQAVQELRSDLLG